MRAALQRYYARWLAWRMPAAQQQRLHQRLIFIVPTGYGVLFLAVACAIFIAGINYQNNLLLGLAFFLASQFVVVIFATYRNLTGLTIEAERMQANFVGRHGRLGFRVQARSASGQAAIWLGWRGSEHREMVSLSANEAQSVLLPIQLSQRGWNKPERLWVESRYPMGLLRAWSHLDMNHACLAWPAPILGDEPPFAGRKNEQGIAQAWQLGDDDFYGLREYTPSDSPRQIDWKSYARGRGLYVKEFAVPVAASEWLDWQALPASNVEHALSVLCYWVLEREQQRLPYGLRLPQFELPVGLGPEQKAQALEALALFQLEAA